MPDAPVFPPGEPIHFEGKPKERVYKATLNRDLGRDIACLGVNLLVFQDLLSIGLPDLATYIALCAITIAIPALAGGIWISRQDLNFGFFLRSKWRRWLRLCRWIGVIATLLMLAATLWHLWWVASVIFLASSGVALVVVTKNGLHLLIFQDDKKATDKQLGREQLVSNEQVSSMPSTQEKLHQ